MTTDQLTGCALDEAAARAMGWTKDEEFGNWWDSGECRGEPCFDWCEPMLAWLRGRRCTTFVAQFFADGEWHVTADGWLPVQVNAGVTKTQRCTDLREALERLVVAVAAREAKA